MGGEEVRLSNVEVLDPSERVPLEGVGGGGGEGPEAALDIDWLNMTIPFGAMILCLLVSLRFSLNLEGRLFIATVRAGLQVTLLGFILKPVFTLQNAGLVAALSALALIIAAREASTRCSFYFPYMWTCVLIGVSVPALTLAAVSTAFVIQVPTYWYAPQYFIPLLGMLIGNVLTAISLGLECALKNWAQAGPAGTALQWRLSLGASRWEASLPVIREALSVGLTPTLNNMTVIGLVSVPGMMTGQILGGSPPVVAAKYQVMIIYMIGGTASLGLVLTLLLSFSYLFDPQTHAIRPDWLVKRDRSAAAADRDLCGVLFRCVRSTFLYICCCCCRSDRRNTTTAVTGYGP
uniref:Uncharacterized protein n=1 Tax=Chromera velia CCMP2878 TaxID=1169474 RepID=A0A0G4G0W1_9ALVE|eukprot:Cvel_510.t1-p1 / transcript=Cvel_510.t1 / gene=Cvel_510 / organism=Chromera_velia_CCMP2878 / gene_product=UPF0014 membrane protein slr1647, putative / transcript_product=UPF0014 membrane protein slr1647, putative / location=Cvel_scaffold16:29117-30160(-) / protein_length=348 / sequence_SO=supercontig / SO=protein_coding / is_pseudo=false